MKGLSGSRNVGDGSPTFLPIVRLPEMQGPRLSIGAIRGAWPTLTAITTGSGASKAMP